MNVMPPKPQAQVRHEKRVSEQTPRVKLQLIFKLDGVSAEPVLIYRNTPIKQQPRWGKTTFYASQNSGHDTMPLPQQRHHNNVRQTVQSLAPNMDRQQGMVARNTHLQNIAKEQTGSPAKHQEKEQQQHDRKK